jgi:hypothetical protein
MRRKMPLTQAVGSRRPYRSVLRVHIWLATRRPELVEESGLPRRDGQLRRSSNCRDSKQAGARTR